MPIGNDVVDLSDAETGVHGLHPRFVERVFTIEERRRIFSSPDPKVSLWTHWAAKESAYKVLTRLDPARVFSPRSLVVELWSPPGHDRVRGAVDDGNSRLDLWIVNGGEWIHAVAALGSGIGREGEILSAVERCAPHRDPSWGVRRAAARALADRFGLNVEELSIDRSRPPRVLVAAPVGGVELSLSHHGRWISFAAALPGEHAMSGGAVCRGPEWSAARSDWRSTQA